MTETDTPPREWVPLEGIELLRALRDILVNNPERHEQEAWLSNYFLTPDELDENPTLIPVDQIRQYATQPIPHTPQDMGSLWPVCGTTGCIAGWTGVLAAPPGSKIGNGRIYFPDGTDQHLFNWAGPKLGLDHEQASFMFSMYRHRERLIRILDAMIESYPEVPEDLEAL